MFRSRQISDPDPTIKFYGYIALFTLVQVPAATAHTAAGSTRAPSFEASTALDLLVLPLLQRDTRMLSVGILDRTLAQT